MTDAYNAGRAAGIEEAVYKLASFGLSSEIEWEIYRAILALLDAPAPAATVDDVAFALWKEGADRAAPNVGKSRTPEGFADLLPEEKERWRSQANAALRALSEAKP